MKNTFHKEALARAIELVNQNSRVFSLTKKMEELSLNDVSSPSSGLNDVSSPSSCYTSSSCSSYMQTESILDRFKVLTKPTILTKRFMDITKMPFIDIPNQITDITSKSSSYMMSLGFRFLPGQEEMIVKSLRTPDNKDGVKALKKSLGLCLSKDTYSKRAVLKLKGMSNLAADKTSLLMSRVLVEAITYHNNYFARFLILVQLGVGCTVWYAFAPGDGLHIPSVELMPLFHQIKDYEPFILNPDFHVHPGLNKISLSEGQSPDSHAYVLAKAFAKEKPFIDIDMPDTNNHILVGVGLGLAIAILFTLGIEPNIGEFS